MSVADAAQLIRDTLTMKDMLLFYVPSIQIKHHRCPCPLHDGKDFNFSFSNSGYKCFVCGSSGDCVQFVQELYGLKTRTDAIQRINHDFRLRLPINDNITQVQFALISRRRKEMQEQQEREKKWADTYHRLLDKWIELDRIKRTAKPYSDEYAEAAKSIDFVGYQIDALLDEQKR